MTHPQQTVNLPVIPAFDKDSTDNILFLGAGGGYDYLGAHPLYSHLRSANRNLFIVDLDTEVGRVGVQPLIKYLEREVEDSEISALVVVDGGVDSLMRGDEAGCGTILEDSITLAAVSKIDIPHKILACIGFGTETEEGLSHYRALENMADLFRANAFLGSCSLTADQVEFKEYKAFCEEQWHGKRESHIHTRIIPAVLGQFEEQTLYQGIDARTGFAAKGRPFVNPLMGIYWFFDLMAVVERNLLIPSLLPTNTRTDALMMYRQFLNQVKAVRDNQIIPL
jgi:hypothetical protein